MQAHEDALVPSTDSILSTVKTEYPSPIQWLRATRTISSIQTPTINGSPPIGACEPVIPVRKDSRLKALARGGWILYTSRIWGYGTTL